MVTVVGLVLDILGAWLLAYEILLRLPKENWKRTVEQHLEHLERFVKQRKDEVDALPDTVYFADDKARLKKDLDETFQPEIERKKKEIADLGLGHSHRSYDLAWLGILLLTVGFLLQIWGALSTVSK